MSYVFDRQTVSESQDDEAATAAPDQPGKTSAHRQVDARANDHGRAHEDAFGSQAPDRVDLASGSYEFATEAVAPGVETEMQRGHIYVLIPLLFIMVPAIATIIPRARAQWLQVAMWCALACHAAAYLFMLWIARSPEAYRPDLLSRAAVALAIATIPMVPFFGSESLFTGFVAVTLLIHNASAAHPYGLISTVTLGGAIFVTDLALNMGWMESPGFEAGPPENERSPILNSLSTITLFTLCYISGTGFRDRITHSFEALEDAARALAVRDDRLREARRELEQRNSVGQPGRLTGLSLGSHQLGLLIGRGGMGEVYAGTTADGRSSAVKVLRAGAVSSNHQLERFLREAEIVAAIDSPHVVRILEVGGLEAPVPYLAMERLSGHELHELLAEVGRLSPTDVTELVAQVASALDAAHRRGVVHRDLKPSNVMRVGRTWKLLDFGVARLLDETMTIGGFVGTPLYAAPEQIEAPTQVGPRTDIHALGKLAYEAITGTPPTPSGNPAAVLADVVNGLPPRPSTIAHVSSDVDAALRIALAKRPEDRYANALELAEAMRNAMAQELSPGLIERADQLCRKLAWGAGLHRDRPG